MSNGVELVKIEGSSNVAGAGYNAATQTMAVQFHNGATYHYANVPPDIYQSFLDAKSRARFLNETIKGKFHYTKL